MIVGVCRVELYLPGNGSLKEKRRQLKPLISRLRKEFNLSVAEVDLNDTWQSSVIGLVTVSNDVGRVQSLLEKTVQWIEFNRPDLQVVDWEIEVL
jgi:uncharacterized protein YlxP (DUF503 family)